MPFHYGLGIVLFQGKLYDRQFRDPDGSRVGGTVDLVIIQSLCGSALVSPLTL